MTNLQYMSLLFSRKFENFPAIVLTSTVYSKSYLFQGSGPGSKHGLLRRDESRGRGDLEFPLSKVQN